MHDNALIFQLTKNMKKKLRIFCWHYKLSEENIIYVLKCSTYKCKNKDFKCLVKTSYLYAVLTLLQFSQ